MSKFGKASIISSIGLAILGLLLFFQSELTIVSISYIIGAILVGVGTLGIIKYINNSNKGEKIELDLVYGVVTVILGIIVISYPKAIASIIPFIIGVLIIINSTNKLQYSLELKKEDNDLWKSTMILSIVAILVGILLIFNPFKGAEFITKVVGILIFLYAIVDIITTISIKKTVIDVKKAIEETSIKEAEVIEEQPKNKKRARKSNDKDSNEKESNEKED